MAKALQALFMPTHPSLLWPSQVLQQWSFSLGCNAFLRGTVHQTLSRESEAQISREGSSPSACQKSWIEYATTSTYHHFSSRLMNWTARPGITTYRVLALGKAFPALGWCIFNNSIASVCLCSPTHWPPNDMNSRTSWVLTCYSVAIPCTVFLQAFPSSDFWSLKPPCLLFLKAAPSN